MNKIKPETNDLEVAIYVRVSTDKQEADNQLFQLREYCHTKKWHIFGEFVDICSGKESSRPEYDLLFRLAHQGHFHILLFWDLSRFSRSGTLFTLQKLKQLENYGIDWVSYKEPYFNTAGQFKDVLLSIMATLAKIEREKISERTKAGIARAKKEGRLGKRGKDKKTRKARSDRGIKRGVKKKDLDYLKKLRESRNKGGRF